MNQMSDLSITDSTGVSPLSVSPLATKQSRNIGIDFLRILSMLLVLVMHILGQGGALGHATFMSANYKFLWLLEVAAYCAVNCYGIITGYVSVNTTHRYRRIISLWFQVAFYTVAFTIIWAIVFPGSVTENEILTAIFPVFARQYWYFTAYFALFCFMPYINKMVHALTKRQHAALVVTIVLLLSVVPTIANTDPFSVGGGYTFVWLMALYIIGAYLKMYEAELTYSPKWCMPIFLLATLVVWGARILNLAGYGSRLGSLLSYTSPLILLTAVALFLFFVKCKFEKKWVRTIISFLAPASFGVYIIHLHPFIWVNFFKDAFAPLGRLPLWQSIGALPIAVLAIYLVASSMDLLRIRMFALLHIPQLAIKIEELGTKISDKIWKLF